MSDPLDLILNLPGVFRGEVQGSLLIALRGGLDLADYSVSPPSECTHHQIEQRQHLSVAGPLQPGPEDSLTLPRVHARTDSYQMG